MRKQTKLKYISMLIAAIVIALFTACEPSVENYIDPIPTEHIAQNTEAPTQDKASIQNDHVKMVLSPKTENLSIKLDADVKMSETKLFPIVELMPKKITQEQVDNFLDTFFKEREDIKKNEFPKSITKSDIKNEIKMREKWIADTKESIPKNAKGKSLYIPKWENQIEQYKELLKDIPDDDDSSQSDITKFSSVQKYSKIYNTSLEHIKDELDYLKKKELNHPKNIDYLFSYKNSEYSIYARQSDDPVENYFSIFENGRDYCQFWHDNYEDIPQLKTTYNEAKALADKALDVLGIEGMDLYKSAIFKSDIEEKTENLNSGELYYYFIYTWDVEGTNVTHTTPDFTSKFYLLIDDSGIVSACYEEPVHSPIVLSKNVELLPFENIMNLASDAFESEDYLYQRFSIDENTRQIKSNDSNIVIDKIELGYMMIKDDAIDNNYILIPVWDFFDEKATI